MSDERVRRGTGQVVVTGTAVLSAYGPGTETLLSGVLSGRPGWGRSGDAYHPCQPRPDGHGLARAITAIVVGLP